MLAELLPDISIESADRLVDDGYIDSFEMVSLVMELNETFGVSIGVLEITPENFNSARAIWSLIESLRD